MPNITPMGNEALDSGTASMTTFVISEEINDGVNAAVVEATVDDVEIDELFATVVDADEVVDVEVEAVVGVNALEVEEVNNVVVDLEVVRVIFRRH